MSFRYIDTHVHFWDRAQLPYPWLEPLTRISAPHGPATYQAETGITPPEKLVFLQCVGEISSWRAEVEWIESLARDFPPIAGIVATAPLDQDEDTLRILDDLAARPLVKGVRHNTQDESLGFARNSRYVAGAQACGERGLVVDLCCYHPQLSDLTALVRQCPTTPFVLDHLGKPGIRDRLIEQWRKDISELAAEPNVTAKLSGIVTEADFDRWTIDDLRPYVQHYLEVFGPERVVFGSDWPVVKLASTHAQWLATARELLSDLSADQQDAVFYRNAERVYSL
ncbi:amidohydrolase family protein [Synoicihabitans lomoniglobus]|uniref:Amidohydrolase family protein n=1 Tax=Synoicihabitans lomoniglobus TaxID=2909285 RepID=A0AAE9ZQ96_9BACT|nr:amidohydrolase family protein [Opitutaceae bacterium LMO-M01]WED63045.1 amidohydrolase family protein [Opitutaceae bacterium LMO-M01]